MIFLLSGVASCSNNAEPLNAGIRFLDQEQAATPSPFLPAEKFNPQLNMESDEGSINNLERYSDLRTGERELVLEDYLHRARGLIEHVERIEAVVNREREQHGLPPLEDLPTLRAIAFYRANDMVIRDYLAHIDPEDGIPLAEELLIQQGFTGKLGELIWQSQSSLDGLPVQALDEWISDPAQKRVIDDPAFQYTGAGLIWDGSTWKIVQVFAENAP
jgi:uncharacterized protein YkwD